MGREQLSYWYTRIEEAALHHRVTVRRKNALETSVLEGQLVVNRAETETGAEEDIVEVSRGARYSNASGGCLSQLGCLFIIIIIVAVVIAVLYFM